MAAPSGGFQPRERRGEDQEQDWDAVAPKRPRLGAGSKMGGHRLIVVLEGASLETVKVMWVKKVKNVYIERMGPCGMSEGEGLSGWRKQRGVTCFWRNSGLVDCLLV